MASREKYRQIYNILASELEPNNIDKTQFLPYAFCQEAINS
jgi:hypothetical protein